jgi:hypothetical protein
VGGQVVSGSLTDLASYAITVGSGGAQTVAGTASSIGSAVTASGGAGSVYAANVGGAGAGGSASGYTGGAGLVNSITNTAVTYGAGGTANNPVVGSANRGNGGGGAYATSTTYNNGASGGSGIVVVAYAGSSVLTTGGTATVITSGPMAGMVVVTFNASGALGLTSINTTLLGSISGPGSLTTNATGGKINLMGTNTYAGTTTLSGGTLGIYNMSAISAGALTAANNTTLLLGRTITGLSNNITLNGAVTVAYDANVEYLVVAGGGGGAGAYDSGPGAGGGAGGLLAGMQSLSDATYAVTVGAGGAAGPSTGSGGSGLNSSIGTVLTAIGGGGGAQRTNGWWQWRRRKYFVWWLWWWQWLRYNWAGHQRRRQHNHWACRWWWRCRWGRCNR